jgi:uncharacterized protein
MAKRELFKIIKEYITYIRKKGYNVTDAYLFGSYAKNKANAESDIDIAVILKEVDNYFDTQVELMKLRRNISIYIEPHPISQKDFKEHPLFNEINKYGLKVI